MICHCIELEDHKYVNSSVQGVLGINKSIDNVRTMYLHALLDSYIFVGCESKIYLCLYQWGDWQTSEKSDLWSLWWTIAMHLSAIFAVHRIYYWRYCKAHSESKVMQRAILRLDLGKLYSWYALTGPS